MSVTIQPAQAARPAEVRPADPNLLNRAEAAAYLGISVSALAKWSCAGIGPAFSRIGRRSWYRRGTLDAWIDGQVPERLRGQ